MEEKTFRWVPLPTWRGRYKDMDTGILGFRPSETKLAMKVGEDPQAIHPYVCSRNGCESFASIRHKGKCFCSKHKPKALRV
jgi:hypothetical protein